MPYSPLLLKYLSFGTRFLHELRLTIEEFILAFWLRCGAVAMATGLVENKAKKWFSFI